MWGSSSSSYKRPHEDIETGGLYPGITTDENTLRWAFIRKVYGILSTQLLLTAVVSAIVVFSKPVASFLVDTPGLLIGIAFFPLILLCPLYCYKQNHPINLLLLGLFTVAISLTVGISCAFTRGDIVLEALVITGVVTVSLTSYTYWASKKGYDFSFLGPMLFVSLIVFIVWGFVQSFFPIVSLAVSIYSGLGAIIFSAYIVYDTDNLIKRFSYDDYIWASISLYLDILNLFLTLLQLLRGMDSN